MRVIVNGEPIVLQGDEATVAALLEQRGVRPTTCAVEVNGELAPRRGHAERRLAEGDRVEIVTLVGGG